MKAKATCSGCGANVGCGCNLNSNGLCPACVANQQHPIVK